MYGGSSILTVARFDLANCLAAVQSGPGSAAIAPAPLGFFRCSVTMANNASGNTGATVAVNRGISSDPTGSFDVDFTQLENDSAASSPILTAGAAASRTADVVTYAMPSSPNWYDPTAGTWYVEADLNGGGQGGAMNCALAVYKDLSDVVRFYRQTTGSNAFIVDNTVSSTTSPTLSMFGATVPGVIRAAMTYALADFAAASRSSQGAYTTGRTGLVTATPGGVNVPTGITTVDFGHDGGLVSLNGVLRRVAYIPDRLPNAQLSDLIA